MMLAALATVMRSLQLSSRRYVDQNFESWEVRAQRAEAKSSGMLGSAVVIALAAMLYVGAWHSQSLASARPIARFELRKINARTLPLVIAADTTREI